MQRRITDSSRRSSTLLLPNQREPLQPTTSTRGPNYPHRSPPRGIHSVGSRGQPRSSPSSNPSRVLDLFPVSASLISSLWVHDNVSEEPALQDRYTVPNVTTVHLRAILTRPHGIKGNSPAVHMLLSSDLLDLPLPHHSVSGFA